MGTNDDRRDLPLSPCHIAGLMADPPAHQLSDDDRAALRQIHEASDRAAMAHRLLAPTSATRLAVLSDLVLVQTILRRMGTIIEEEANGIKH